MPTEPISLQARRVVWLLAAAVFINYFDRGNLATASPLLQRELALSNSELGALFSAFFWSYAPLQPIAGWLAQRFDVRYVLGGGLALWALATALTGLVTSFAMIFMLRLVLGFGESVAYPCNAKFLAQRVPSGQRGRANGLIAVGQSLGPTCGTLVGGLVMAHFGWRPAFMRCGIYPDRPLVCRIYPAEINPFVALKRENKACPPEAWAQDQPLFQRGEVLMDDVTSRDIAMSRAADVLDADLKSRLCLALNLASTALVHEAVSVYSPTAQTLLSALAFAIVADSCPKPAAQWRFVSDQQETLESLAKSGGITLHLRDAEAASFQYLGFKREAIFGLNTDRDSLLRNH